MKTPHSSRNFRVTKLLYGVVALALILTAAGTISLAGAETSYQYRSEPGDYIGGGGSNRYNSNSATINISGTSGYFTFSVNTATENWSVVMAAPAGELLHPGVYYNAERAAFRTGRSPGLDVYGDGRGCNQVYGSFAINQIETDASGTVILLDATFTQQCETSTAPSLFGIVKYSARPLSYNFVSDPGDYIGGGVTKSYEGGTSLFSLTGSDTYLQYSISGQRDNWIAVISPPTGQHLQAGTYNTMRFADSTHAGLDVFGDGRGCNSSTGTLTISAISFSGGPKTLSATFEQHCEGAPPALHGTIHYYK